MLDFLSEPLRTALRYLNINLVYELRVRAGKPAVVNYKGNYMFLSERGISDKISDALIPSYADIESMIYRISEYSVYSVTEQMKHGFLTGACGERIGLAGTFVYENGEPFTIKEVTSLNIRIPHEIKGAASFIFDVLFSERVQSCLIMSPPGRGKTTILRDLTRQIAAKYFINILINDERNEITAAYKDFSLDVGAFCDVIRYTYKQDSLTAAIRTMRPDLIVTDELAGNELNFCLTCIRSGVNVIATAHSKDIESLLSSESFSRLTKENLFDSYVVLDPEKIGRVSGIYNARFDQIYSQ